MTAVDMVRLTELENTGRELKEMGVRILAEVGELRRKLATQPKNVLPLKVSPSEAVGVIQELTLAQFQISRRDFLSPLRAAAVVLPRQASMALCRDFLGMHLAVIGQRHGGRDHGTVLHAIRAVTARAETDPAFRRQWVDLQFKVREAIGEPLKEAA